MEALRHAQAEADRLEIRDDTTEPAERRHRLRRFRPHDFRPAEPRRKSGEGCFGGFM
jgi:hypothetical protein